MRLVVRSLAVGLLSVSSIAEVSATLAAAAEREPTSVIDAEYAFARRSHAAASGDMGYTTQVVPGRLGVSNPAPADAATSKSSTHTSAPANWKDPVAAADARFTAAAAGSGAVRKFGAADVRVMVRGAPVALGVDAGESLVNAQKLGDTWQHVFAGQSEDGTLGYTWGYIGDAQAETPAAAYVNIWQRPKPAAPWQIVALSLQVLPKKKG